MNGSVVRQYENIVQFKYISFINNTYRNITKLLELMTLGSYSFKVFHVYFGD